MKSIYTTVKTIIVLAFLTALTLTTQAQNNVGIGTTTPNGKAILELQATDKGLLVPRLTNVQMNAITTPPNGLLVYNTTQNCFNYYNTTTIAWKSLCSTIGIVNSGDTVIINLLKVDSLFAHYLKVDSAFITNLFATYVQADSAYIKNLVSNYIKSDSAYIKLLRTDSVFTNYLQAHYIVTDSIYGHLGRFDSLVIKGLSIDSLIKQITTNYLSSKDTIVLKYLKADSIYATLIKADSAFIKHITTNYLKADTIIGGWGSFDSLYVGGQNILNLISDSIEAKAWLLKGNNASANNKLGTLNARNLHIVTNNTERISVMSGTGNVGIGQTLPSAKLDVVGDIQFTNDLKPAGLAGTAGQVLTSAGAGIAPTWITPSNASSTSITDSIKAQAWLLKGNSGTNSTTNFIGTTDGQDLIFKVNNTRAGLLNFTFNNTSFGVSALPSINTGGDNTAVGMNALSSNTLAAFNTAIGSQSLTNTTIGEENTAAGFLVLTANTTGSNNTGIGSQSLASNISGNGNSAVGYAALAYNKGSNNTAVGVNALETNTTGGNNVAIGTSSQQFIDNTSPTLANTSVGTNALQGGVITSSSNTALENTAIGYEAMKGKTGVATTGNSNVAVGSQAMIDITSGGGNAALGVRALQYNTSGSANTAIGLAAMQNNTTGSNNTALGDNSLNFNTIGIENTALGERALIVNGAGNGNVGVGKDALGGNTTGNYNTAVGHSAGVNSGALTKAVAIGYNAKVSASNSLVLGGTGVDAVKVGIGTASPAQELDVVGNLQFSKALMPNANAGTAGQLLTSAGAGVAPTWINANTLPAPASAWNILGNAGTVAGTNFLGTTDNVDLVFKTANTERWRIVNNSTAEFKSNSSNLLITKTGAGRNLIGFNNIISGGIILGDNNDLGGGTDIVIGSNNNSGGGGPLNSIILGSNFNSGGGGPISSIFIGNNINLGGSGPINSMILGGTGVNAVKVGIGTIAPSYPLHVVNNSAMAYTGKFENNGTNNDALWAANTAAPLASTLGNGLYATTTHPAGNGVYARNFNASGTGVFGAGQNVGGSYLPAGSGASFSGDASGQVANALNATGTGIRAMGNNVGAYPALVTGSGGAFAGTVVGVYGNATNAANSTGGGYFTNGNGSFAYVGYTTAGGVAQKINGPGAVSTIVKNTKNEAVNLYCPESPEILFQDFGKGTLVNGVAHITLDADFTKNIVVNDKHDLRVIIQLEGDCNGVFVTNKTSKSFDVKELKAGLSNVAFTYFVTANRADAYNADGTLFSKFEDVRFGEAPSPMATKNEKAMPAPIRNSNDNK